MRWLVEIPCLALGDQVIQKDGLIPAGVLPDESVKAFVAKGYLELDEVVEPEPVVEPEVAETLALEPVAEPEPEPEPTVEPEPAPKKRTRKKAKK